MIKSIFLDANILLDIYDETRYFHRDSVQAVSQLAQDTEVDLFSSYDIITTLYHILSKKNKMLALDMIIETNELCEIVSFSNREIQETCLLMKEDGSYQYNNLNDTIQYVMAKKMNCDSILSNKKGFISADIRLISSNDYCKIY